MQRDDWRTICKCPDYEINSAGDIRKKGTDTLRRITVEKSVYGGYSKTVLRQDGKLINVSIHREVALAFLGKPEGKVHVHHIDGNKQNNDVSNLEWVSRAEHSKLHTGRKYRSLLTERKKDGIL